MRKVGIDNVFLRGTRTINTITEVHRETQIVFGWDTCNSVKIKIRCLVGKIRGFSHGKTLNEWQTLAASTWGKQQQRGRDRQRLKLIAKRVSDEYLRDLLEN